MLTVGPCCDVGGKLASLRRVGGLCEDADFCYRNRWLSALNKREEPVLYQIFRTLLQQGLRDMNLFLVGGARWGGLRAEVEDSPI